MSRWEEDGIEETNDELVAFGRLHNWSWDIFEIWISIKFCIFLNPFMQFVREKKILGSFFAKPLIIISEHHN